MFLTPQDFIGKYALSKGMFSTADIQEYIDRFEPRYLKNLFGVKLYNEFITDLNINVPQSPNFIKVFEPLSEDVGSYWYHWTRMYEMDQQIDSEGIKTMLLGFVYYEYAKDLVNQMTPFGNTKPKSENSDIANTLFSTMYNRYNEAIRSYQSIQDYIILNQSEPSGQLVNITMTQAGTNVVSGTYAVTGGTGTGATFNVVSDVSGTITEVTIADAGIGYSLNDQLSIDEGNNDLIVNADYVGIGTYSDFKGLKKLTAYWL